MYQVPNDRIAAVGVAANQRIVPTAIDLKCAHCRRDVTFTLQQWTAATAQGLPNSSRCPRCGQATSFLRLGGKSREELRLYVDAENLERSPLAELAAVPESRFSPKLKKAYDSAIKALSNEDPEATAVHCRRVLEGVTASLLRTDELVPKTLARRLELLAKNHGDLLTNPILELSRSLKDGGNLGAHFDDEVDTSLQDAAHMVELLDNLITYLYVVPQQIQRFREDVLGDD